MDERGVTLGEWGMMPALPGDAFGAIVNAHQQHMECLDCSQPIDTRLAINKDHNSDFYQWFYFRLVGRGPRIARSGS
jgi:hypothetical protein